MTRTQPAEGAYPAPVTAEDIKRILGDVDDAKLLDLVALRPTMAEVEEASLWLAGDTDVFGAGTPLKGTAGEIVEIVTADETEENDAR